MNEEFIRLEEEYRAKGIYIAGADEAGRGPLCGPVVACAAVMNYNYIEGIDDSKKLSEKKRELLYPKIIENAVSYGIGIVDEKEIDEINILNATRKAFKLAIEQLTVPYKLYTDYITKLDVPEFIPIVKGDAKVYSIACASIIAKVTRDHMLIEYAKQYPEYGFDKHKGYGTKAHYEAIKKYGILPIHRRSFLKNLTEK